MKKPPKKPTSLQQGTPVPDKRYELRPGGQSPESQMVVAARTEQFSGPLPPPEILKRYDEIVPGTAKNIIESFVNEGRHRREREDRQVAMCEEWAREDVSLQKRGQVFGFILAFTGIAGGLAVTAFGANIGAQIAGAGVSGVSLAAIVVAFLQRGRMNKVGIVDSEPEESEEKSLE